MHRTDKATVHGLVFAVLCLGIAIGLLLGLAVYGHTHADDGQQTETATETVTEERETPDCSDAGSSIDNPDDCNDEWPTETNTDGA